MKTALLIDDDRAFREALSRWLSDHGWKVLQAEDGEAGIQMAFEHRPQVVFCDLLMPRCNGFQVCRQIRRNRDRLPATSIIVTTGSGYATDRANALEAGADEYIIKPVVPADLTSMLDRLLENGSDDNGEPTMQSNMQEHPTKLKFWGVRGSIPTPGPETIFYGGNTSCIEIRSGGQIIVLDAGTGIRPLGVALNREFGKKSINLTLLISHTHWDHIQGFPYFLPAYNPKNKIMILGFEGARKGLENILSAQMESSYFPISMREMPSNITIQELKEVNFNVGPVRVQAEFLNHPGICTGYRIFASDGSISYLTDVELFQRMRARNGASQDEQGFARGQDERLANFVRGSDILILDAQYDAEEYESRVGWGHSCLEDSVEFAIEAGVSRLFLFHHDPDHDDECISRFVARGRELAARKGSNLIVEAAREGLEISLGKNKETKREKSLAGSKA